MSNESQKQLSESEKKTLESNMVWVFGTVRSGTTWLGTQLLKYKSNVIWNEPYVGHHVGILKNHANRNDYFFSSQYKEYWLPIIRDLILFRTYLHSQTVNDPIIIKDPNGIGGAGTILECFPNSKLIFLLRDGRDIVDSLIDAHKKNSWNRELEEFTDSQDREKHIKKYSKGWVKTMEYMKNVFQKHNEGLKLLVKYEDLRYDTINELKKIYQFIKVNISDDDLKEKVEKYDFSNIPNSKRGAGKFTRFAKPGSWKQNFSEKEKEIMNTIMSKNLKDLGYEI